jgi:hypothetical protein
MHEEKRLQPTSDPALGHDLESTLHEATPRIAVPMAIAQAARRQWHQRILNPRRHLPLRPDVLQEQEAAPRTQHAPDLSQTALWITYRTEDEGNHHTVKMSLWEWKHFDGYARKRERNGSISAIALCIAQHGLIWFDGLDRHDTARIIKREILPATSSDFQDHAMCLPNDLTPQGIELSSGLGLFHHPIVKRGETRVGDVVRTRRKMEIIPHHIVCFLSPLVLTQRKHLASSSQSMLTLTGRGRARATYRLATSLWCPISSDD